MISLTHSVPHAFTHYQLTPLKPSHALHQSASVQLHSDGAFYHHPHIIHAQHHSNRDLHHYLFNSYFPSTFSGHWLELALEVLWPTPAPVSVEGLLHWFCLIGCWCPFIIRIWSVGSNHSDPVQVDPLQLLRQIVYTLSLLRGKKIEWTNG